MHPRSVGVFIGGELNSILIEISGACIRKSQFWDAKAHCTAGTDYNQIEFADGSFGKSSRIHVCLILTAYVNITEIKMNKATVVPGLWWRDCIRVQKSARIDEGDCVWGGLSASGEVRDPTAGKESPKQKLWIFVCVLALPEVSRGEVWRILKRIKIIIQRRVNEATKLLWTKVLIADADFNNHTF